MRKAISVLMKIFDIPAEEVFIKIKKVLRMIIGIAFVLNPFFVALSAVLAWMLSKTQSGKEKVVKGSILVTVIMAAASVWMESYHYTDILRLTLVEDLQLEIGTEFQRSYVFFNVMIQFSCQLNGFVPLTGISTFV